MRKTLFAMLGLVALGLWALPTLAAVSNDPAKNPPKVSEPIPLENRAGIWQSRTGGNHQGTLSGSLIQVDPITTWYLYPGACTERAAGTWVPYSSDPADPAHGGNHRPQADSLNSYAAGSIGPYGVADQSLSEILWKVSDNATCTTGTTCPAALNGTRMIWCGKFDTNWVVKYGYPNLSYQILYINSGITAVPPAVPPAYTLGFNYQFSIEFNYDYVWLIGAEAAGGGADPIGNTRATLDNIIAGTQYLIRWTGSIVPGAAGATGGAPTIGSPINVGANPGAPATVTGASYTIPANNQGLYLVFRSDCLFSSEDGLWPEGHGQLVDNITINGSPLYTDEAAPTGVGGVPLGDTTVPPGGGIVLKGTAGAPIISARVAPGVGTLWQLVRGNVLPSPDTCSPQKSLSSDLIFEGGNAANFHTVPNQFNSIVTCSFPIPAGVASVLALWDEYLDLPRFQGYVQYAEFRIHKDGSWGNWNNTSPGGGVTTGARQSWGADGDELGAATQSDSVQIRYNIQCIPFFAADHNNCGDVIYGVLYDNFRLELVTGVPAPIFGVFVGAIGQSTFVDGTMGGTGCSGSTTAAGQCWPGVRGSDVGAANGAVHDNFNSPLGDSITLAVVTGLRKNGKGVNWRSGFDKNVNFGLTIAHTNPNYVAAFDAPRVIYRLFDPTTKNWSPWDSSELDANGVAINAGDTVLIDSEYRMNWPPRDKVAAGASLPGGFTLTGKSLYSQINFMPRGTRLQYYWKGVDAAGGRSYQFSSDAFAREVLDLPFLPCQTGDPGCVSGGAQPGNHNSIVATDIIEYNVLPGVYAAGAGGTQLAGRTNTPLLDLDGSYTRWGFQTHATVQALRVLGVRADRYRTLQGLEEGGHIGGHEFAGTRQGRLSNYFPNMDEYGIKDSLSGWYRIMIESSHTSTTVVDEESDSKLIQQWWSSATPGTNGGDRCLFASGDDYFSALLATGGVPHPNENALASQVFGVSSAQNQWNGGGAISGPPGGPFPLIKDLFADPAAGPALGSGSFQYVIDGGCPAPNRFDALTKGGSTDIANVATYPTFATVTNVAGVANSTESDVIADNDRAKALGYGFSIQFVRQGENLVDTRAQILYKFLTSCRGARTAEPSVCWPCPTDANKYGNWATLGGFQAATFGPLYPLQDATRVMSGTDTPSAVPVVNRIQGNFPNPFNPQTRIRFSASQAGKADVRIFDVTGRLVRTLTTNAVRGVNEVHWNGQSNDGRNLASGVYFVKVKYPDGSESLNGIKIAIVR